VKAVRYGSLIFEIHVAFSPVPTAVFMLKAPVPGKVKTRLAASLGADQACQIYRCMVERIVAEVPIHWLVEVHGAPPGQLDLIAAWLGSRALYRPQCDGDLGTRLIHASEAAFSAGAESVVLLGGDCPWQSRAYFQASETALHEHDLVIGPAVDGGYTLLACKTLHRALFEGIAWSTPSVLRETLAGARSLGLRAALLDPLEDVDDDCAWQRARAEFFPDFPEQSPATTLQPTELVPHA
jgi:rSAM/selenodomain-associated transferase 1